MQDQKQLEWKDATAKKAARKRTCHYSVIWRKRTMLRGPGWNRRERKQWNGACIPSAPRRSSPRKVDVEGESYKAAPESRRNPHKAAPFWPRPPFSEIPTVTLWFLSRFFFCGPFWWFLPARVSGCGAATKGEQKCGCERGGDLCKSKLVALLSRCETEEKENSGSWRQRRCERKKKVKKKGRSKWHDGVAAAIVNIPFLWRLVFFLYFFFLWSLTVPLPTMIGSTYVRLLTWALLRSPSLTVVPVC